ncbi:MAG TPA: efflux RND transporter periplasmic adaptor subunit [Crenalkalicoccus sp.]|jgi:RND family efflux transporter MFP subunit|nr:efflux RND transporter periplasmic adaptor subunit [Crenalkalicoccus sp.]
MRFSELPGGAAGARLGWRGWRPLLLLLFLLPAGCDESTAQDAAPAAPPKVTVSEPLRRRVTQYDEYTGRFGAVARVDIRARVSGQLEQVHFTDGQLVKQGDLLFSLDQRPYLTTLHEAEGRLAEARSRADLAQRELGRANELRRTQAVPESTVDQRADALRAALANISITEAQLQRARLDLEWTRVVSPITGRIGRRLVDPGAIIAGGDASFAGGDASATLLATVVSIDPIDLYFDVDQTAFLRYQRLASGSGLRSAGDMATPVSLALEDDPGFIHQGRLNFVDNVADQQTGTVRMRARFPNPDRLFLPGVFARIRIPAGPPHEALLLPDEAIGTDQTRRVVSVVGKDNVVALHAVRPGRLADGLRVIEAGLKGDEQVVVNGLMRARPGQPVTPERAPIRPLEAPEAGRFATNSETTR